MAAITTKSRTAPVASKKPRPKLILKPPVHSFEPRDPENPHEATEFNRFIEELREQSRVRRQ
jgi:hypothetical protein